MTQGNISPRPQNLRFQLRAYENSQAVRLAAVLIRAGAQPGQPCARTLVKTVWANLFPNHTNVSARIRKGLTMLRAAAIVDTNEAGAIIVQNHQWLMFAAENLSVVVDIHGKSLPPSAWPSRPRVPAYLLPIQDELELTRTGS